MRGAKALLVAAVLAAGLIGQAAAQTGDADRGEAIYTHRCMGCHGDEGDGLGPAAERLNPPPRDFTLGLYKIKTTGFDDIVPNDADLLRMIRDGMPGTAMPGWGDVLSEQDMWDLIAYLKVFAGLEEEEPTDQLDYGTQVASSDESIAKGGELFRDRCSECHGDSGKGVATKKLKGDNGERTWPRNLTKAWTFRRQLRRLAGQDSRGGAAREHGRPGREGRGRRARRARRSALGRGRARDLLPGAADPGQGALLHAVERHHHGARALRRRGAGPPAGVGRPEMAEDAVAVQLPVVIPEGMEKPYFGMGDAANPVNIWHWKSGTAEAPESVQLMNARGFEEIEKRDAGEVRAKGLYHDGTWRVAMVRPLATGDPENDIQFREGRFTPIAFAAWDGSNSETGSKHTMTTWYWLQLTPPMGTRPYLGALAVIVLLAGGQFFWVRGAARKRDGEDDTAEQADAG
jgi:mono/diheme cytochrome c family protein